VEARLTEEPSPTSQALDDTLELARRRERTHRPDRASRLGAVAMGVPFLLAAGTLATFSPHITARQWVMAAVLGALYLAAGKVEFEVAVGSTVPSEQVLVAMFLVLPPTMPPLVALAALICVKPKWMLRPYRGYSFLLRAASAWQTMGPALVLYHFGDGRVRLSQWPLYVCALLAQFAIDTLMACIRVRSLGMSLRSVVRPLTWTWCVDAVLATVGLSAVVATRGSFTMLPFLIAPVGLIWLLASDRRQQVERSLSLGKAVMEARDEARLDPLTGVANRRAWEEAMAAAQTEIDASWGTRIAAIAVADVDRLKRVNDTLGHSVGDALIAATASALLRSAPEGATIARLGGDEFGVLWVTTREEFEAFDFVARMTAGMTGTDTLEHVPVLASIGFATSPPAATVDAALQVADAELFAHKQRRLVT